MLDLSKPNILTDNKDTLKEISADASDKTNIQYMTQSSFLAVNFDSVKNNYFFTNSFDSARELRSNDALVILNNIDNPNGKFVFIEFKNGEVWSKQKRQEIRTKISESLLIFNDIFDVNLTYDRDSINYILVYNKSKNAKFESERTSALSGIGKILASTAKMEYNISGFDRYKVFFHAVKTINEDEFQTIVTQFENSTYKF